MTVFTNPPESEMRALLSRVRTIAVVGLSPKPGRPSYQVVAAMQQFGYRIIPVRPAVAQVLGEKAYADLYQLPERTDLVDVFRAPEFVDQIVDACIELGFPTLWLQDGVVNPPAAERAHRAGLQVIMDRCVYRDYRAWFPTGHMKPTERSD